MHFKCTFLMQSRMFCLYPCSLLSLFLLHALFGSLSSILLLSSSLNVIIIIFFKYSKRVVNKLRGQGKFFSDNTQNNYSLGTEVEKTDQKDVQIFYITHFLLRDSSFLPNPKRSASLPNSPFSVVSSSWFEHLSFLTSLWEKPATLVCKFWWKQKSNGNVYRIYVYNGA